MRTIEFTKTQKMGLAMLEQRQLELNHRQRQLDEERKVFFHECLAEAGVPEGTNWKFENGIFYETAELVPVNGGAR